MYLSYHVIIDHITVHPLHFLFYISILGTVFFNDIIFFCFYSYSQFLNAVMQAKSHIDGKSDGDAEVN